MKVVILAFLLALAGVLFFAFAADRVPPGSVSWVNDTVSWVSETSPKIQNELAAEMGEIKKAWEDADQWGEEMGTKVRAGLKKEFDQLMRNSATAGQHERENESPREPEQGRGH
jgi:hypothetical protein